MRQVTTAAQKGAFQVAFGVLTAVISLYGVASPAAAAVTRAVPQ